MNIAIFASAFHPSVGGVEELCRQLAHAYVGLEHKVSVWTERWPETLPSFESYEEIPVHRFPMRVPIPSWKSKLTYALTHRRIRSQIVRAVREHGIDVLHVQCVSTPAWYALHASEALRLPLVATLQGELNMDAAGVFQKPGMHQRIMRTVLQRANAITACSQQTLREAEDFFGEPFGLRSRVIYNGIELRDFEKTDSYQHPRPYIFAIGRHVREKGFDILLQAFSGIANLGHDLILAGDGSENTLLKSQAIQLGLAGNVHFPGRVDHKTAVRLFKGCSFFVLPSRHEPLGIVNLEAMAAGKAIVASRVGGVPEILTDGETALLVHGGDSDALSTAMRRLVIDIPLRTHLGQAGMDRVRDFDWSDLAEKYLQVYRAVLKSAPLRV